MIKKKKGVRLMLAGLFVSILLTCCIGRFPLTVSDLADIFTGSMEDAMKRDVFFKIRLPRTLFAAMTGAALSVAGMVYQELFGNPLAAPDVLGVSGGAGVGAAAAVLLGLGGPGVQAAAFSMGLLAVFLTMALGGLMGRRQSVNLLLAGIVVKALADAGLMALKYFADPERQLPAIDYWLMGSFHAVRWEQAGPVMAVMGAAIWILWLLRRQLFLLSLGEEEAKSLGVSAGRVKIAAIAAATALVASGTAVTGTVSWTGLIVPHMVRFFAGENLMKHFGLCALTGAVFMIWVDTAARSLTSAEIPVSILTSGAGAVFLVLVLFHKRRENAV